MADDNRRADSGLTGVDGARGGWVQVAGKFGAFSPYLQYAKNTEHDVDTVEFGGRYALSKRTGFICTPAGRRLMLVTRSTMLPLASITISDDSVGLARYVFYKVLKNRCLRSGFFIPKESMNFVYSNLYVEHADRQKACAT